MTKQNQKSDALHEIKEILQIRMVSKELSGLPNDPLKLERSRTDLKKVLPQQLKKLNELWVATKKSGEGV